MEQLSLKRLIYQEGMQLYNFQESISEQENKLLVIPLWANDDHWWVEEETSGLIIPTEELLNSCSLRSGKNICADL